MYTLNLPGIETSNCSRFPSISATKSIHDGVIFNVSSSARISAGLSIPNVLNLQVLFLSLIVITVESSAFMKPVWHLSNSIHLHWKYSSMLACSFLLIWSSVKFVKTPISKSHPSTLCIFIACDDTSIIATSTCASAILAKYSWISSLSGVVLSVSSNFSFPM